MRCPGGNPEPEAFHIEFNSLSQFPTYHGVHKAEQRGKVAGNECDEKGMTIFTRSLHLLALLLLLLPMSVWAADIPVHEVGAGPVNLSEFTVLRFSDPSLAATVDDVRDGRLVGELSSSHFFIPVPRAVDWLVFSLRNRDPSTIHLVLQLDETILENADLYQQEDERMTSERNGIAVPLAARGVKVPQPSFAITLAADEKRTFYVKTYSLRRRFSVPMTISDANKFSRDAQSTFGGYCLFFGAALALLIYNIFLTISLRDRLYLFYVIFSANFIIFVLMFSGFNLYLFDNPQLHYGLSFAPFLSVVFQAMFVRRLLKSWETMPRADLILIAIAALFVVETALAIIDVHNRYETQAVFMTATATFLGVAIYAALRRLPLAGYLLFGMGSYVIGIFLLASVSEGLIPRGFLSSNGYLVGSLVELVVFSLALGYRVRMLKDEKLEAQDRLLLAEQGEKLRLERLIAERTADLRQANQELETLSRLDGLTGLSNRRHFDEILQHEWRRLSAERAPLCLILGDIDHFKRYNDTLGHQAGDDCLRAVALAIRSVVVRRGDLATRYGGEEFAILLPDCSADGGRRVAEAIRASIHERALPHAASPLGRVTMSFGITSSVPDDATAPDTLVARADKALYDSKEHGRDRVTIAHNPLATFSAATWQVT